MMSFWKKCMDWMDTIALLVIIGLVCGGFTVMMIGLFFFGVLYACIFFLTHRAQTEQMPR